MIAAKYRAHKKRKIYNGDDDGFRTWKPATDSFS